MGYLETGMRVLDAASSLLSRLQELAVLGANDTNTTQDHEAINLEAEALGDEFNRLMTTSAYKGKNVFVDNASSEYVSVGGRNAEMTFGIGKITYTELYDTERTISFSGGPNNAGKFNLVALPSDGVNANPVVFGQRVAEVVAGGQLDSGKTYVARIETSDPEILMDGGASNTADPSSKSVGDAVTGTPTATMKTKAGAAKTSGSIATGDVLTITGNTTLGALATGDAAKTSVTYAEVNTGANKFVAGRSYVIHSLGTDSGDTTNQFMDAYMIAAAATNKDGSALGGTLRIGQKITVKANATTEELAGINSLINGVEFTLASETLTEDIEAVQAKVNTARVQAGSQYAALESAVDYTTDLTAQYELGFNTVNDVNFSMETAHLAKNQILQQAATAMLAQANQGQQGLLQLIQG
jgi:flagellin